MDELIRTELLLGSEAMDILKKSRIAVFGIGGVGGYVCEALVRSGVGAFDLIDNDKICKSNLNRQIIALNSTIGRYKTEVMREHMLDINPSVEVRVYNSFFLPENADTFPFDEYDYIVDAIDTVTAKIELVRQAHDRNIPIISSMGTGNKLEASALKVADIYETKMCPLARVMRNELRKRGIKELKVVYSEEKPIKTDSEDALKSGDMNAKRQTPGSVAFVPPVAGMIIAGEVVKDLTGKKGEF